MVIFKKLKYQESFMRPNYLLFLFAFKKTVNIQLLAHLYECLKK